MRPSRRSRTTPQQVLATPLLIGLVLPLLGFGLLAGQRTVTVVVDGAPTEVSSHAPTVEVLLERLDLDVSSHDRIVPSPDTPLARGMVVEVVHAREITLLVGDTTEQVRVAALTVEDAIDQLGLGDRLRGRAVVRPSRQSRVRSGMVVSVAEPLPVTVRLEGDERSVITDASTVSDLLDRLGIELGPDDRVTPGLVEPLTPGMAVTVERVELLRETRRVTIPFDTDRRDNPSLARGQEREVRPGTPGVVEVVEEVELADGVERRRSVVSERTVRGPETRIVEVGTGATPRAAPPPSPAPAAAPPPPTEEQPPPRANVQDGKASWYDNPYGGMTAAHRTLPRGTIVTVVNVANGRSVQVRINDRGPYVSGRIIDLNREAFAQLASPSLGVVRVRIEW